MDSIWLRSPHKRDNLVIKTDDPAYSIFNRYINCTILSRFSIYKAVMTVAGRTVTKYSLIDTLLDKKIIWFVNILNHLKQVYEDTNRQIQKPKRGKHRMKNYNS